MFVVSLNLQGCGTRWSVIVGVGTEPTSVLDGLTGFDDVIPASADGSPDSTAAAAAAAAISTSAWHGQKTSTPIIRHGTKHRQKLFFV